MFETDSKASLTSLRSELRFKHDGSFPPPDPTVHDVETNFAHKFQKSFLLLSTDYELVGEVVEKSLQLVKFIRV